jgi:hypothetical protein
MSALPRPIPSTAAPEEALAESHEALRRSLLRPFPAPTPADRWRLTAGGETIADIRVWLSALDADSFYRLAVALHGEEWRRSRGFGLGLTNGRLDPVSPHPGADATPPRSHSSRVR